MYFLHSVLSACSIDQQARPKSTQANELNNDWRLAKRCWLPSGYLSPCRSNSTRAHIICIHITTLRPFLSIMGHFSVSNPLRFFNKRKKKQIKDEWWNGKSSYSAWFKNCGGIVLYTEMKSNEPFSFLLITFLCFYFF